jgi:bloom syndrome protein
LSLSQQFGSILSTLYENGHLQRFIIDEVHCVSTWGKDFRAEYEKLSELKKNFPKVPILALTATVTEVIKQDIIKQLRIEGCFYFQSSFNRPNLHYEVREKTKRVNEDIEAIINRHRNETGIIYCLSKKDCQEMSNFLGRKGHKTAFYFADIN